MFGQIPATSSGDTDTEVGKPVAKQGTLLFAPMQWIDMELPLSVIAMPNSASLRVTMLIRRFRSGGSYTPKGRKKPHEIIGFEAGVPMQPKYEWLSPLHDAEFVAAIDSHGQLFPDDATG